MALDAATAISSNIMRNMRDSSIPLLYFKVTVTTIDLRVKKIRNRRENKDRLKCSVAMCWSHAPEPSQSLIRKRLLKGNLDIAYP